MTFSSHKWGIAAFCHLQARQCQDCHFMGGGLNYTFHFQRQWCCSSNVELGSKIRASIFLSSSGRWNAGVSTTSSLKSASFSLFQGKEGGFIVRDSSKAGKYTVSVFAKSTGWVLLFQGPGDKGQRCFMVCPSCCLCPLHSKFNFTSLLGSC